ncbi:hypothetical protein EKH57_16270 [Halorubrum sp. BOL3-1]|uniref:hypothetical protein n=1 Tax=Halorubrum sp. BOL3-1 TaxID=2497325 RepID=UPI0010050650|nr:hypothetical protein [Halorubrum sp. BOL3-1]QAU14120.1 hypothetical protein EKH57_16270 [Halorubrum sp. BOL3-1]
MSDSGDSESTAPWTDRDPSEDTPRDNPSVDVIPGPDAGTVTFAWRHDDDKTTTAWITADAGLLVDVTDIQ